MSPRGVLVKTTLAIFLFLPQCIGAGTRWQTLAPGLELGTLQTPKRSTDRDSPIIILRIDPNLWELTFVGLSQSGDSAGMTAREWSRKYHLAAAINAGMFMADYKTHIGYLRFRERVINAKVNGYRSVAAFDPKNDAVPRFRIFDLDAPGVTMQTILRDYSSTIQNLRLIKRPGQNRWAQEERMWSEAALGEDRAGRILFLFSQSPFRMRDLSQELLSSDLGVVCAQHLEGGHVAQLYVGAGDVETQWSGSYGRTSNEDPGHGQGWPVPNVLGIRPRHR